MRSYPSRVPSPPERRALDPERLAAELERADLPWRDVRVLDRTGSTNHDVAALAAAGAAEGTVVTTDLQTAGRGRLARRWETPWGAGTATSVLVRPDVPARAWGWLPLLTGVAVARALGPAGVRLKWPNDLVSADDGKVGGILCERLDGGAAVVGIGVNVDQTPGELPPGAVALASLLDPLPARERLVVRQLQELYRCLRDWQRPDGQVGLRRDYLALSATVGRPVEVWLPDGSAVVGAAVGIDPAGRLEVEGRDGVAAYGAGDVVHLRPADP